MSTSAASSSIIISLTFSSCSFNITTTTESNPPSGDTCTLPRRITMDVIVGAESFVSAGCGMTGSSGSSSLSGSAFSASSVFAASIFLS